MNVNTILEKDTVVFKQFTNTISRGKLIQSLNNRNIFTVKDLIASSDEQFTDLYRNIYVAIRNIYKYEYLGDDASYDAILDKTYNLETQFHECVNDLTELGIIKKNKSAYVNFASFTIDKNVYKISMKDIITKFYASRNDIAKYYVSYLNNRFEGAKTDAVSDVARLEIEIDTLKKVFNSLNFSIDLNPSPALINFRNTIEVQIKDLNNKLNSLLGNDYTRKRS